MRKWFSESALQDVGLLLIRTVVGVIFIFHGGQKLFGLWSGPGLSGFAAYLQQLQVPVPALAAVLAGAVEFLGGMALITGYHVRVAAVPLVIAMGVAIGLVHRTHFALESGGMEYALTLAVVVLGLALTGPGRLAISGNFTRMKRLVVRTRAGLQEELQRQAA